MQRQSGGTLPALGFAECKKLYDVQKQGVSAFRSIVAKQHDQCQGLVKVLNAQAQKSSDQVKEAERLHAEGLAAFSEVFFARVDVDSEPVADVRFLWHS